MSLKTPFLASVVGVAAFMTGCGNAPDAKTQTSTRASAGHKDSDEHKQTSAAASKDTHDHSGWWCNEHGIPEEECAQCNSKVAADFQKKGDWCKEHDRPDSQCFKCHPELQAKFAAKYEAKFGKQPPTPQMN